VAVQDLWQSLQGRNHAPRVACAAHSPSARSVALLQVGHWSADVETYFQAAFRVQSPLSIKNPNGDNESQSPGGRSIG
jgi:hypothetical protein